MYNKTKGLMNPIIDKYKYNKRGDISVVLLVLMVLGASAIVLIAMYMSGSKAGVDISDGVVVENSVVAKQKAEFYIKNVLNDAFVVCYVDATKNLKFGDIYFEDCMKREFTSSFGGVRAEGSQMVLLKGEAAKGNFELKNEESDYGQGIRVKMPETVFRSILILKEKEKIMVYDSENVEQILGVFYRVRLGSFTSFVEMGLPSFKKIQNTRDRCFLEKQENRQSCLAKDLSEFGITDLSGKGDTFKMISKKKYFYNAELKPIEFTLQS